MSQDSAQKRVADLLAEARAKQDAGQLQAAFQALKEASSLEPTDANVKAALDAFALRDGADQFTSKLKTYLDSGSEETGQQALKALTAGPVPPAAATNALNELLERRDVSNVLDQLTASLLTLSIDARKELAARLTLNATALCDILFARGPESFKALTSVPLEDALWNSTTDQEQAQRSVFQFCARKLVHAGVDDRERPMRAIARQLAVAPNKIKNLINEDVFRAILSNLDIRRDTVLRSQATLATSKILETLKERGESLFAQFINSNVARQKSDDLIVAFSAAAAVFPIIPAVAAKLFLTDGFVQQLIPSLEYSAKMKVKGSSTLERAALELMSAACIDRACREAIDKHCAEWLRELTTKRQAPHEALAALILAKIGDSSQDEVTSKLAGIVLRDGEDDNQAIEGLAYTTLQPKIKEQVALNTKLLKRLVSALTDTPDAAFGPLTVFANLTAYRPTKTEEQKKIAQLKAYANSQKPEADDPLDNDTFVTARARKLLDADLVPALVTYSKQTSSTANIALVVRILLSMSKEQKHRPKMAQQSAVRALLQIRDRLSKVDKASPESSLIERHAAHAIARLLISVNPAHIFSSGMPATSAVSALMPLLSMDQDGEQRDLLPTFEALLAMTNLASMEDSAARTLAIRVAFERIEDLMFSPNTLIQRASVELVCNLMLSPSGVAKFADGSPDARRRMQILLALADVDDMATRRAAGGALAMLMEWDAATAAVLDKERGVKVVLDMCSDNSAEIVHRGLVCLANMLSIPGEIGDKAKTQVKAADGYETVKEALKKSRDPDILAVGVDVLKKIT